MIDLRTIPIDRDAVQSLTDRHNRGCFALRPSAACQSHPLCRKSFARFISLIAVLGLFFSFLLWSGCDKGLAPPPGEGPGYHFPLQPAGGNPMGRWVPDSTDAVDVHFLAQVPADSVHFETAFEGIFAFEQTFVCSVDAVLRFKPIIFTGGDTLALDIVVADSIKGQGAFEIVDDKVLLLPVESDIIDLSVLGFSAETETMDFITKALEYEYQGFYKLEYFLVLHMIREEEILGKNR